MAARKAKPAVSVSTEKRLANLKVFKAGSEWTGNANGRPKDSRNKLGEEFVADFLEVWKDKGKAAIEHIARKTRATLQLHRDG